MSWDTRDIKNITAKLNFVIFVRDEFTIAEFETGEEIPSEGMTEKSSYTTDNHRFVALGDGLPREPGKRVVLSGYWEMNPKRENRFQFRVLSCADFMGNTREEIIAYLSSDALKGIGKKSAEQIYDAFGDRTLEVLAQNPQQLLALPGFGEKRVQQLVDSFQKNQALQSLTLLLAPKGVPYPTIVRIYQTFGSKATEMVRENPYVLCQIPGMGFRRADALSRSLGADPHSRSRIEGCVEYVLNQIRGEGHMYMLLENLLNQTSEELLQRDDTEKISREEVQSLVYMLIREGRLLMITMENEKRIYNRHGYLSEYVTAQKVSHLLRINSMTLYTEAEMNRAVAEVERDLSTTLDQLQRKAVLMAMKHRISIITGGPGTGKTTILFVLVKAMETLKDRQGKQAKICLAAPTGRAARRMEEQTGHDAATLHSLLELRPNAWSSLDSDVKEVPHDLKGADMLIVDEFSMVDGYLMAELMHVVPDSVQMVFVGDADQLPSVGPGNVLSQLLQVKELPHVMLEKVFRQGEGSVIPINSQKIRSGCIELEYNRYFKFISCSDEKTGAEKIREMLSAPKAQTMMEDIQILAPMRKHGEVSTNSLNKELHDVVNPPAEDKHEATVGNFRFREGDRVMQIRNTEEVSNGEVGTVVEIVPESSSGKESFSMKVRFRDGDSEACIEYTYEDALDLVPAIAITIHKSQGGEYPFVIIPIFRNMEFFLQRSLLYTAVTRAKRQVVLVGNAEAIEVAIRRIDSKQRNSSLAEMICANIKHGN